MRPGTSAQFERLRRTREIRQSPADWFESKILPDNSVYLRWTGLFEFHISADGRVVLYRRLRRATQAALTTYLLGEVLSCALAAQGREALHATAIVVDGAAIAFVGDSGYGKSTLGAAFLAKGFAMLTDDVLTLERDGCGWIAHAGPARVKLFPAVASRVLGRNGTLMNPGTSKLVIPIAGVLSAAGSVPLAGIYVLPPPGVPSRRSTHCRAVRLRGRAAFLEISRATFSLIKVDAARQRRHFGMMAGLVSDVPVIRLTYPRRLARLDAVCEKVLAHARRLRLSGAALESRA